ncbi:MAG TPA: PIN domain-containing protein [Gaiella sp.]|nr:PIN domain-containing protein [Gaiella sp.]
MFCFDTDVVAAALLRDPPMHLVRRLARTPASDQCTTSVTVAELAYGAARNGREDLIPRLRELVVAAQSVIPFDDDAAEVYGALRAQLEQTGTRLDEPSLRIASIAVARDLTLVTGNVRLYDRVPGLRIENWLEPDELDEVEEAPVDEAVLGMNGNELAARRGDGTVRHPGMVPSLEARAREAARAAQQADEAHTNLA